jgi:O-antigen/teichoic acid export membrane protein
MALDRIILTNAASLLGTTVVTSGFGFFYWWLAARFFPSAAVGFASAAISAMTLLGTIGILGFGTWLIGELPRQPKEAGNLITTALVVAGGMSGALGVVFALGAYHLADELAPLATQTDHIVLFSIGVILTAITLVLDQALIGLLRGELQLRRNIAFALAKLVILFAASIWLADRSGLTIYETWALGNLVSLMVVVASLWRRKSRLLYQPQWGIIRGISRSALEHHVLNLILQTPGLLLPMLITALLSATFNASFYVAWMIVGLAFAISGALTTVLYAVGAADASVLAAKIRLTLMLSLAVGGLASVGLFIGARPILSLFGSTYADQAEWCLRILALGVFPVIIKNHYVAICRTYGKMTGASRVMALGSLLELALAAFGVRMGGLAGMSVGWIVAVCLEAGYTASTVYRAAASPETSTPRLHGETAIVGDDTVPIKKRRFSPERTGPIPIALGYLVAVTFVEECGALASIELASVFYGGLLIIMLLHAASIWERPSHNLLLALVLVPLLRLLSFSLSLASLPEIYRYLAISIPLLLSAISIARRLHYSKQAIGISWRSLPIQVIVGATGIGFGYIEYQMLQPQPLIRAFTWDQVLAPAAILLFSTGFVEEIVFRGIMQKVGVEVLGTIGGMVYVAALYAALYTGYQGWLFLAVVFLVSLYYAWVVRVTGSIVGVTLSHGLASIMVFIVLPFMPPSGQMIIFASIAMVALGLMLLFIFIGDLNLMKMGKKRRYSTG